MSSLIESTEIVFPEDVEEEVNSCFENLFSGRLSAITLLARIFPTSEFQRILGIKAFLPA